MATTLAAARRHVRALVARPEVQAFHRLWYEEGTLTWGSPRWLGIPMQKNPLDLWVQQELIATVRPTLILETGSWIGGSAVFYATVLDLLGIDGGRVISVDVQPVEHVTHPRVTFLTGSSVSTPILKIVSKAVAKTKGPVLVVLDSDHSRAHVAAELKAYAPFVSPGSWLIVEDTNVSGKPVRNPAFAAGGGPYPAVAAFLKTPLGRAFEPEPLCERFLLTMHPGGWLQRRPKE